MLKTALAASAAVAAIVALSAPVYANNTSATITINGSVGAKCNMDLQTQTVDLAADAGITDVTDNTGHLNPALASSIALPHGGEFWCNGAGSTLSLSATPFSIQGFSGSVPADFATSVNYKLAGTLGTTNVSYDTTSGGGAQSYAVGIFDTTNPLASVQAEDPGKRLVAGSYQSIITVTLNPAQ